eukprot:scaffold53393_cov31-Phaeocystis_antarctica.AAC.1
MPPGRRARAVRSVACASRPRWQCSGSCGSTSCGSTSCPMPCQDAATGQRKVRGGSVMATDGAGPSVHVRKVAPGGRLLLSGFARGNRCLGRSTDGETKRYREGAVFSGPIPTSL